MRDRRRLTGALAIAGLLLAVLLAWQRPNPFASHKTVRALFADAHGLASIGADVRMAGTPVGKVVATRRVGDHAELTLRLDPAVGTIHRDAHAEIRPRLMFEGTAYVDLQRGSRSAPPLQGRLPLSHTRVYVPLSDAFGVLRARSRANLRSLAGSLAAAGRPPSSEQLQGVLRRAPALTRTLAPVARAARGTHARELREAVSGLSATARAVAAHSGDLPPIEDSATRTSQALLTSSGLDATLTKLPATTARVRVTAASFRGVLAQMTPIANELRPAAAQLAPTLASVRSLLRAANPALAGAKPLIVSFRSTLDAMPQAAPAGSRLLAAVEPTLEVAQKSLLPALDKTTNLGTPAYLAFLGLFAGGGGASRPFGAQGQGHFMRFGLRFLTGAGQPLPPCSLLDRVNPQLAQQLGSVGGCTP